MIVLRTTGVWPKAAAANIDRRTNGANAFENVLFMGLLFFLLIRFLPKVRTLGVGCPH
jgi:hypothetical protein